MNKCLLSISLLVAGALLSLGCRGGSEGASGEASTGNHEYTLVNVQAYGWQDTSVAHRRLTEAEAKAGGAVLSRVVGLAEASDGRLFALDGDFKKVVEFAPDRGFVRVILGGYGEGPGEFSDPFAVSLDDRGVLRVLDQRLNRLTLFDTTGRLVATQRVQSNFPLALATSGDNTFILSAIRANSYVVTRLTDSGQVSDSFIPVDANLRSFRLSGYDGAIAPSGSGAVLYSPPTPGSWYILGSGRAEQVGAPLFPDDRPELLNTGPGPPLHVLPVGTQAIGRLPDGRTVVVYRQWNIEALRKSTPGVSRGSWVMAVFDASGGLLGRQGLDPYGAVSFHFTVSRIGPYLYAVVNTPYPRIVKFKIEDVSREHK